MLNCTKNHANRFGRFKDIGRQTSCMAFFWRTLYISCVYVVLLRHQSEAETHYRVGALPAQLYHCLMFLSAFRFVNSSVSEATMSTFIRYFRLLIINNVDRPPNFKPT